METRSCKMSQREAPRHKTEGPGQRPAPVSSAVFRSQLRLESHSVELPRRIGRPHVRRKPAGPLYCFNRKNFFVPEIGLVTMFCPLTTTGAGETVLQFVEARFVLDCKMNLV